MDLKHILTLLIITELTVATIDNNQKVCINLGCVQSTLMNGYQNGPFEAFLGVPFAKPPVGDLRFSNPVPADPWEGTLNNTQAKPDCIQKNYLLPTPMVSGDEDCLYLNIYRPIVASRSPLSVMVYFYGGGFFSGSANPLITGPEYFMDTREVILVTVSYRLGALGFLSTGDDNSPGNYALKDQSLALKWVQKYIRSFGGSPDQVTIFGQSAGGVSTHMHMISPLSTGLFQRAIVNSGNAIAPYNKVIKDPLAQARKQGELVGIPNANTMESNELIKALRQIDATKLVNSGDGFKYWHVDPLTTFRPVIERNRPDAFLTCDPQYLIENGDYNHVPWMTGFVPFEGAVRALSITSNQTLRNDFNSRFDELLGKLLEIDAKPKRLLQEKVNRVVDYYLDGLHQITDENANRFGDIISDRAFLHPLYKTVQQYTQYANLQQNPVYLYKFSYKGPYSYSALYTGNTNDYGVVHCDELLYLFRSPLLFPIDFDTNSQQAGVIRHFVDTYVSFARFGQPKKWSKVKPCTKQNFPKGEKLKNTICNYQEFMNFDDENSQELKIQANDYYDVDMVRFWDELLLN